MILQTKVPITPTRRRLHTIYKAEYPLQWKRRYATVAPPRIPPDLIGSSQSKSSSTARETRERKKNEKEDEDEKKMQQRVRKT